MSEVNPAEASVLRANFYVTDDPSEARLPWSVSRAAVDVGESAPVHGLLCRDCGVFLAAVGPVESVESCLRLVEHHECVG